TPRVLCALFAGFVSLFALDAFEPGRGLWTNLAAFAIHSRVTFLVLALLAIGWRWPVAGGVLLISTGVLYAVLPGVREHLSWIAVISGPAWLTGALFMLSGRRQHAGTRTA